jgi:hypothetical protein
MKTLKIALLVITLLTAAISAVCWFWSARIRTPLPMGYLSGPPKEVVDRINKQSLLNAIAAASAGVAVITQGILSFLPST